MPGCKQRYGGARRATPTSRGSYPIVSCDGGRIGRIWLALHPPYVELEHLDAQLHFSCRSPFDETISQSGIATARIAEAEFLGGDTLLLLLLCCYLPQLLHRSCTREPNSHGHSHSDVESSIYHLHVRFFLVYVASRASTICPRALPRLPTQAFTAK